MGKPYLNLVGVGDALDYLKQVPDCSIDSCCADAPYGLGTPPVPQEVMFAWMRGKDFKPAGTGFMYSSWDAFVPGPPIWKEVYRVLKPGGWCLVFFGTRTYDWGTMAIRFAGFEVQDCISWVYGCLDDQTEVLTARGWVRYGSARKGDLALCYDADVDTFSWDEVDEVFTYEISDPVVALRGDRATQIVTGDHRCLVEQGGTLSFQRADTLQREVLIPVLEALPELLASLPVPQFDADQPQQNMRQAVLGRNDWEGESRSATRQSQEYADCRVRGVRQAPTKTRSMGQTDQEPLLQSCLLRQVAIPRPGDSRPAAEHRASRPEGMDGRESRLLRQKDVRLQQSGVERRSDLLQEEGKLRERKVRSMPAGVQDYGAQGRLRDGAQTARRASHGPTADQEGDGSPRGSRSDEQCPGKPDAVCVEPGAQTVRGVRFTSTDLVQVSAEPYEGVVWCIKTPTGAFVARRPGGLPFITGNSGFPKSLNISKAVDAYSVDGKSDSLAIKHANDELRTDTGRVRRDGNSKDGMLNLADGKPKIIRDEPATEDGKRWQGWGTAMKPAQELICMARKPFDGTYARHVLEHGTGALNIDASRIAAGDPVNTHGRWPTNVLFQHLPECQLVGTKRVAAGTAVKRNLPPEGASRRVGNKARTQRGGDITYADADGKEEVADWACAPDCPIAELEHQSRKRGVHGAGCAGYERARGSTGPGQVFDVANGEMFRYGDAGGASRFFYCAKAANKERWSYCRVCKIAFQHDRDRFKEHEAHKDEVISHPTQKPLKLMEYLVRLVTQPGGVVLDPFCGTGSTSVAAKRLGLNFVTCDLSEDYARIARARLGLVGREAESALTSGAYFCPGCKANGEIKLIAKEAVDRMRERGKKTTCVKCMTRYSYEELAQ